MIHYGIVHIPAIDRAINPFFTGAHITNLIDSIKTDFFFTG
jgi:hypothetical protein